MITTILVKISILDIQLMALLSEHRFERMESR
jgi:hypothetical protein